MIKQFLVFILWLSCIGGIIVGTSQIAVLAANASSTNLLPVIQYEIPVSGLPTPMKIIEFYDKKSHHCIIVINGHGTHTHSCENH